MVAHAEVTILRVHCVASWLVVCAQPYAHGPRSLLVALVCLLSGASFSARSMVQHEHAFDLSPAVPKGHLAAQPWGTATPRNPRGQAPSGNKRTPTSTSRADYAWPVVKQKPNAFMSVNSKNDREPCVVRHRG